jgi:ABC-type Fe3+-hydroxamate transport system substrate-binding protein
MSAGELSRRRLLGLLGAGAGLGAVGLAGCGGPGGSAEPHPGAAAGFPVTITDSFGQVTVEGPPARIASVGRTDHDVLLALGIVPATVYQFVPSMTRGVGVWARDRLGPANPVVLTYPLNLERVASVAPDLILDVQSAGDAAQYRTLSHLAPTIGLPPDTAPNTVRWQDSARIIATAVGRAANGDALVAATDAALAKAAAAHPELAGRTVSVLLGAGDQLGVYTVRDTRMQVLTALGLRPSPYVAGLDGAKFYVGLSPELVGNADADVVLLLTQQGLRRADALARYPVLATLPATGRGRLAVVEDFDVSLALSNASVLSVPYAVDRLLPLLTAGL